MQRCGLTVTSFVMAQSHRWLGDFSFDLGAFSPDIRLDILGFSRGSDADLAVAFVVPVYNQARLIGENLSSIVLSAGLPHELVVIVDGSTDNTWQAACRWAETQVTAPISEHLRRIALVNLSDSVFETVADMIGIELTVAPFIVEVQADMTITEMSFDAVMVHALRDNTDLVAVGGRGAHALSALAGWAGHRPRAHRASDSAAMRIVDVTSRLRGKYTPSIAEFLLASQVGRVGSRIELPTAAGSRHRLFIHETTMRGPLAIRRSDFSQLGGFDTRRFFLGNDDHDLAVRAWNVLEKRVAYTPIGFESPLDLGSTRAKRTDSEVARYRSLRDYYDAAARGSALAHALTAGVQLPREIR